VRKALRMPCMQIVLNAGIDASLVVQTILDSKDVNFGYDVLLNKYCNLIEAGIIDPTKVVRTALMDAAGVASLLTTAESVVVELPKDEKDLGATPASLKLLKALSKEEVRAVLFWSMI
jgi:chaperonin GroEL